MNAVIYARFSSQAQRDASIEDQVRACRAEAERRGDSVVHIYADRAKSGTTTAGREEFRQMVDDAKSGGFSVAYVYKLDRFARNRFDFAVNRKALRECGVELRSVAESVPEGPEGIILESMLESMAEYYSANLSQNVRRGMEGNALKCMHNGVRVYGYDWGDDGCYVVNPIEADVVREVFTRRLDGETINSIKDDLVERGVTTQHGRPCCYSMVERMLHNEKYTGVYQWGDVRVEDGMPQIIEPGLFDMVQRAPTGKRRKSEKWNYYPLAGGVALCAECGSRMVGISSYGKQRRHYRYYRCGKQCGCRPVRADWLEAAIVEELRALLEDREAAREVARAVGAAYTDEDAERHMQAASTSLAQADRAITNIMRAVEQGLPYDDVSERLSDLKLQKARAEAEGRFWSERTVFDVEDFADFLQWGADLDDGTLLEAFVWRVAVWDGCVAVALNYEAEGLPATIDLMRVKSAVEEGFEEYTFGRPAEQVFKTARQATIVTLARLILVAFRRN